MQDHKHRKADPGVKFHLFFTIFFLGGGDDFQMARDLFYVVVYSSYLAVSLKPLRAIGKVYSGVL